MSPTANSRCFVNVDAGGNATATYDATRAIRPGSSLSISDINTETILLKINGGATQTITFTAAATTAQLALNELNAQLIGGSAVLNSGEIDIQSDTLGTGSSVEITGGTAISELGHTVGTTSGTGDVANIKAVTNAEIKATAEADISGLKIVSLGAGLGFRIDSNSTGPSSSILVDASSTVDAVGKLNLDNVLHSGTSTAPDPTLLVEGKDVGAYGNDLTVEISAATNGQANSFNLIVLRAGLIVESFPNMRIGTAEAATPQYCESVINDENTGSNLIRVTDQLSAVPPTGNIPAVGSFALTTGDDGLTSLDDNDFLGSSAGQTGLHGFDTIKGIRLVALPGQATALSHNGMLTYVETFRNGAMFAVLDPPANQSANQIVTYVETTASLLESSEFGAIYWPRVKIRNSNKTILGSADTVLSYPSGVLCGIYARTDASQLGGIYQPPAGIERGIMKGVVGFETDEVLDETKRDLVFPKRINPLTTEDGLPFYVDGPLTLKSNGNFPTVAERRGVIHIEQSVKIGIQFARHSNNDATLRARVDRTARSFLITQMRLGAFRTRDPDTAFYVDVGDGINTEAVIFSGKILIRMGLATQKPALFVVVQVSQDTRALELEIAGAAA